MMEAIVLAAGRGQRMEGLSKPFFKPLLELNGVTLLEHAVKYAEAAGAEAVHVVVSPANAEDIQQVTQKYGSFVRLTTQEYPLGPGHATMLGLQNVLSKKTMLLMSDNIMNLSTVTDMGVVARETGCDMVGVRFVELPHAGRFTRVRAGLGTMYSYVEGAPVTEKDIWPSTQQVAVWCGPLVFGTQTALSVFLEAFASENIFAEGAELKIGPCLNQIMGADTRLFDVEAFDVGVPSAYLAQQSSQT